MLPTTIPAVPRPKPTGEGGDLGREQATPVEQLEASGVANAHTAKEELLPRAAIHDDVARSTAERLLRRGDEPPPPKNRVIEVPT